MNSEKGLINSGIINIILKTIEEGTEMRDIVHYRLPFGVAGEIAHPIVKKKLLEIFQFRFKKTNELFGNWPDQKTDIRID
jgi:hypothetical protein